MAKTKGRRRPGRPSYDTSDPFAYPISRLAREAMRDRLEIAILRGRLPVDHGMYLSILGALFPEDFGSAAGKLDSSLRLTRLQVAAFAQRLERKAP